MTDKEIDAALRTVSITIPHDEYRILQGRAVEKAVLQKLAAGVSVEPVAWYMLAVDEDGEDEHLFSTYPRSFFQRLYTANAVAAARVQENERCANVCEAEQRLGIDDERSYNGMQMAQAIRARIKD